MPAEESKPAATEEYRKVAQEIIVRCDDPKNATICVYCGWRKREIDGILALAPDTDRTGEAK